MTPQVCVFGGALVDRIGTIESPFFLGQSHPGHWDRTVGGVAANVARHLSHFGADVRFASAFGDDDDAKSVKEKLKADGLDLLPDSTIPGGATPSYTVVHNQSGDVIVGLADMALHSHMDKEWAERAAAFGTQADIWVADTNISEASLAALCALKQKIPLFIVAVSPAKTSVIASLTSKIDGLICNRAEAEAIIGSAQASAIQAAESLVSNGVASVIVSNGSAPCAIARRNSETMSIESNEQNPIEAKPIAQVKSLTGVGDTFAAASLFQLLTQKTDSSQSILEHANAAALLAMAEKDTCPKIGWQAVQNIVSESTNR